MTLSHTKLIFLALLSWRVFAADSVDLGVTGNIVASPCLFNDGGAQMDISLGNIQAINMMTPGSSSTPVAFNLLFTQCPTGTRSVTVSFTGNPDPVAGADYYMNSGSATNVAVALRDAVTSTLKGTGASITQNITTDRTATIPMLASVISPSGGATPGSISAVVVMTMQYN